LKTRVRHIYSHNHLTRIVVAVDRGALQLTITFKIIIIIGGLALCNF